MFSFSNYLNYCECLETLYLIPMCVCNKPPPPPPPKKKKKKKKKKKRLENFMGKGEHTGKQHFPPMFFFFHSPQLVSKEA